MSGSSVLTVEEVARELRIGRGQAYEAVRRGDIPSIRLGRTIRVPRQALENLLQMREPVSLTGSMGSREDFDGESTAPDS